MFFHGSGYAPPAVHRIKLGELLVRAGVLDELRLKSALNEQRKWGGQLGKVLVDLGYVEEDVMVRALSKQLGLPRSDLRNAYLPSDVLRRIDPEDCRARQYCPERLDLQRKLLVVAMADPTDVQVPDDLTFRTGYKVETAIAGESEVARAVDRLFFGREEIEVDIGPISTADGGVAHGPYHVIDPEKLSAEATMAGPMERFGPTGPERFGPVGTLAEERFGPTLSQARTAPVTWGESTITASLGQDETLEKLRAAQKRQNRAIRAMLDLLMERGLFSEEEFRAKLGSVKGRSKR